MVDFAGWRDMVTPEAKTPRRRPSDEDLEAWDEAATQRHNYVPPPAPEMSEPPPPPVRTRHKEPPVLDQMESLLRDLYLEYPIRSRRMLRDIKWLRGKAHKRGLSWGRKSRWSL